MELTQSLKNEYLTLWASCEIKPQWDGPLDDAVATIKSHQSVYMDVAKETGVPWYVVAIIHGMEASFNFTTHLHNGDRLTARTVHVPAGRPKKGNPPFSWKESAIDALNFEGATGIKSWDLPTTFYFLEGYNGWGYRFKSGQDTTPKNRSPYIYSGTTHYEKGKFVRDGEFDKEFVSGQLGCMAMLFGLVKENLVDLASSISQKVENNKDEVGSVASWQNILNGCGYIPTLLITGQMDEPTKKMTEKFQNDLGLSVDSDKIGTVTLSTWQAGLAHKKLPDWSNITPPFSEKIDPSAVVSRSLTASTITQTLERFYSNRDNYQDVYDNVMEWYGTTTNGCIAFLSTALRLSGCDVPMTSNDDGAISLFTLAFSSYLQSEGWEKFSNASLLQPGDVVFTIDSVVPSEGIPAHAYMFAGWSDQSNSIAWVIDNQGFTHERNILKQGGGFNFTPFDYFLRA